ncbi:MarR family transcriptional regulator [Salmonella enterica]|nr:MarR family transcriptional regulator [Salmonella enterica]EAS9367110.1 MarR family transcriptional regulator [Salmonella enterica]
MLVEGRLATGVSYPALPTKDERVTMKYQQLTEGLLYQIGLLCEDKISQAEIARRLGVSKSTVSRELRRNCSVDGYQPAVAQKLSISRRKAAGKQRMHEDTVFYPTFNLFQTF